MAFGEFFDMGGYAAFVWPSFAVTTVVMVAVWIASRRALVRAEAELAALDAQNKKKTDGDQ